MGPGPDSRFGEETRETGGVGPKLGSRSGVVDSSGPVRRLWVGTGSVVTLDTYLATTLVHSPPLGPRSECQGRGWAISLTRYGVGPLDSGPP